MPIKIDSPLENYVFNVLQKLYSYLHLLWKNLGYSIFILYYIQDILALEFYKSYTSSRPEGSYSRAIFSNFLKRWPMPDFDKCPPIVSANS